jgi:hypothetical protein
MSSVQKLLSYFPPFLSSTKPTFSILYPNDLFFLYSFWCSTQPTRDTALASGLRRSKIRVVCPAHRSHTQCVICSRKIRRVGALPIGSPHLTDRWITGLALQSQPGTSGARVAVDWLKPTGFCFAHLLEKRTKSKRAQKMARSFVMRGGRPCALLLLLAVR